VKAARVSAALLLLALVARAGVGLADEGHPAARDLPAAEALYEAGKELLESDRCAPAIERLTASQALDPAVGTLLLLGHCQERLGLTASAWASFRAARSLAQGVHQPGREQIADTRARALEPRLARLEIWLPGDVDTASWSISENGRELPRALIGVALPVDPGLRELLVSAPGYLAWTARVETEGGATTRVRVPALVPLPAPAPSAPAPDARASAASALIEPVVAADAAPGSAGAHATQRVLAYLGVGLGALGLGTAAAYGISARDQLDEAARHCPGSVCDARGQHLRDSADERQTIATVSAVGGAVLLASGIGLWLAMPDETSASAWGVTPIGKEGLGMALAGTF